MKYEEIQADTTEEVSMASLNTLENLIDGPFFLEDTGLYIKSLNGFPGPYSSYVMKSIGNEGILKLLDGMPRDATFLTVVSFRDHKGKHQFRGECKGGIQEMAYDLRLMKESIMANMEDGEKFLVSMLNLYREEFPKGKEVEELMNKIEGRRRYA